MKIHKIVETEVSHDEFAEAVKGVYKLPDMPPRFVPPAFVTFKNLWTDTVFAAMVIETHFGGGNPGWVYKVVFFNDQGRLTDTMCSEADLEPWELSTSEKIAADLRAGTFKGVPLTPETPAVAVPHDLTGGYLPAITAEMREADRVTAYQDDARHALHEAGECVAGAEGKSDEPQPAEPYIDPRYPQVPPQVPKGIAET